MPKVQILGCILFIFISPSYTAYGSQDKSNKFLTLASTCDSTGRSSAGIVTAIVFFSG